MRKLTPLGLAAAQIRRQWALALALALGIAASVALTATAALMQSVAGENGLQSTIRSAARADYLEVQQVDVRTPQQFDGFQAGSDRDVRARLGGHLVAGAHYISSGALAIPIRNGVQVQIEAPFPLASYYDGLERHAVLTQGAWATDAVGTAGTLQATVSETAAGELTVKPGDVICVQPAPRGPPRPQRWCVAITGIWRPLSDSDPYWAGTLPDLDLTMSRGGFFAAAAAMPDATLRASQVWEPQVGTIHASNASQVSNAVNRLRGSLGVSGNETFISGLDRTITAYQARLASSQLAAVIVGVALLALAAYSVAFVALHFLAAQRPALVLWRTRGWSRARAWRLLMLEFALVSLVAVPAGAGAAVFAGAAGAAPLLGGGAISGEELVAAAPALVLAVLALTVLLGVLAGFECARGLREARAAQRSARRARNLDLLLGAAGVLLLAEVRLRTPGPGDPLSLLLPALGVALLAVASLRLLPLAARLARASSSVPATLAAWQLERRPGQYARLALLLSFSIAIGLFAAGFAATDHRNALDRSAYAAGGDVRAAFGEGSQPPQVDQAVASLPSVAASTEVFRGSGRPGRSDLDTTVLGIDGQSFWRVAWRRGDLAQDSLDDLTRRLVQGDPDGVAVPGRPATLTLTVYSSGLDAQLEAELTDASGAPLRASFGSLAFSGWQTLDAQLPGDHSGIGYPLRLRSLTVTASGAKRQGELALSGLRAGGSLLEDFASGDGWWQHVAGTGLYVEELRAGGRTAPGGAAATSLSADLSRGALSLDPPAAAKPLPALVSSQTLQRLGLRVNQSFPLHLDASDVEVVPVGVVDYFPTLYPGQEDFLVLPRIALLDRLVRQNANAFTNEAWLKLDGPAAATLSALGRNQQVTALSLRDEIQREALSDPLRVSLDAELAAGFLAALAMVVVGFGLHFLLAARARVAEYAILQANGLPAGTVRSSLLFEQAVLLLYSLVTGAAMGLLMAWVVLPAVQFGSQPADTVPPTVLQLDPLSAGGALLLVTVAAALAGLLAGRLGGRFDLLDQLRSLA